MEGRLWSGSLKEPMDHIKIILFTIAFLGLIILALLQIVIHIRFVLSLKKRHPDTWKMLGCPTPSLGNSITQCLALNRLLRQVIISANDDVLLKQGRVLQICNRVYLLYFIVLIFLFAFFILRG